MLLVQLSNGDDKVEKINIYQDTAWRYVDFDESMQSAKFQHIIRRNETNRLVGVDGEVLLAFCRQLYEKHNFLRIAASKDLKIPKIIHQIWIGSAVPAEFEPFMNSWIKHHVGKGWSYKLWTDDEVKNITLYNQAFYDETDNYGVKADILKWEIIYQFGGVYVDMDFECLQPLDTLHYTYDFYTALQPFDTGLVQLGAALFAAWPGHPILKHCIETIRDDWHKKGVPQRTGPIHFTKSFYITAGKNGAKDIAFPAHYFYPLGSTRVELRKTEWIRRGSYAVHHWAKTWNKPQYRRPQFRSVVCGGTLF